MPHLITREEAINALGDETGECFICDLIHGNAAYLLERRNGVTAFLSRYPRFWGQVMVAPDVHSETFTALDTETWTAMNTVAHKAARIAEKLFSPARCYIASTGSAQQLPMTCPHIHINIIPVPDAGLKPADVFTWKNGLCDGTAEEWSALFLQFKSEWEK
jgi:diadenosine tetraphosphate (Ap4A) HIT family hydrolase